MPVPKDRVDKEYYALLKQLNLRNETEPFLGLVHGGDLKGTEKRIEMASKVVGSFGVATECGMGRMQKNEFDSVLENLAAVTAKN
jgi:hypothetical protein